MHFTLNDSMEQSPSWEANSHSASKEIPCLLWNPKVHYRVHKIPPLVPILNHTNPVNNLLPYFPKIHSNIDLLSTSGSSDQNFVLIFSHPHACYMPANPILLNVTTLWCTGTNDVRRFPKRRVPHIMWLARACVMQLCEHWRLERSSPTETNAGCCDCISCQNSQPARQTAIPKRTWCN